MTDLVMVSFYFDCSLQSVLKVLYLEGVSTLMTKTFLTNFMPFKELTFQKFYNHKLKLLLKKVNFSRFYLKDKLLKILDVS